MTHHSRIPDADCHTSDAIIICHSVNWSRGLCSQSVESSEESERQQETLQLGGHQHTLATGRLSQWRGLKLRIMPSEATTASSSTLPTSLSDPATLLKCTLCGISQAQDGSARPEATIGEQRQSGQTLCEGCLRTIAVTNASVESLSDPPLLAAVIELEADNVESETSRRWSRSPTESETINETTQTPPRLLLAPAHPIPPVPISYASAISSQSPTSPRPLGPHSLPVPIPRPWSTSTTVLPFVPSTTRSSPTEQSPGEEKPGNPLLDVAHLRVPSVGRGCLYPGSVFRGTQTSGRSAYEVEVKLLVSLPTHHTLIAQDVSFPDSTLSGYLSISHLTDTHPHLTTFVSRPLTSESRSFQSSQGRSSARDSVS